MCRSAYSLALDDNRHILPLIWRVIWWWSRETPLIDIFLFRLKLTGRPPPSPSPLTGGQRLFPSSILVANLMADPPRIFTNPCSIEGQGDIFGMGIRISLYMEWYTTALAYVYEPELATQCTLVNYCFSIAVAICALVHPGDLHARIHHCGHVFIGPTHDSRDIFN